MECCQLHYLSSTALGTRGENLLAKVRDEEAESRSSIAFCVQVGLLNGANMKSLIACDLSAIGRKKKCCDVSG